MRKILIVSSDRDLLRLLGRHFSSRGYRVLAEKDAALTFDRIWNFGPDILVVDLILDDNNGGAISHQVKSDPRLRNLPVIILSDYESETGYPSKFGCDRVIFKSGDITPLAGAVHDLLEASVYVADRD